MNVGDTATVWMVILVLGAGTYLLRYSFLGVIGQRSMPAWVLRLLRYTPVAVLPGLVAPLVMWPAATDGAFDLPRVTAAAATLVLGLLTRNTLAAIFGGASTLYLMLYLA